MRKPLQNRGNNQRFTMEHDSETPSFCASLLRIISGNKLRPREFWRRRETPVKKIVTDINAYMRLMAGDSGVFEALAGADTVNDVWIAAQAIETGSTRITFDRQFDRISALRIREFGHS